MSGEPWGHKYIIYIYVEGERDSGRAIDASGRAAEAFEKDTLDFVGVRVEPVMEKPQESIAT